MKSYQAACDLRKRIAAARLSGSNQPAPAAPPARRMGNKPDPPYRGSHPSHGCPRAGPLTIQTEDGTEQENGFQMRLL